MTSSPSGSLYSYLHLQSDTDFRIVELLPGQVDEPIVCLLRIVNWSDATAVQYEAISYSWGDPTVRAPVFVNSKKIWVTVNLHTALRHLRHTDRSRLLWADALCIDQSDIPERSAQVKQMRKVYEKATRSLLWIGPDAESAMAENAMNAVRKISNLLCDRLDITPRTARETDDYFQRLMLRNRDKLPAPEECDEGEKSIWEPLVWFYSHRYFTRVWIIQEITANQQRVICCGHHRVDWDRVDMVASYILAIPIYAQTYGFSNTNCWCVATVAEIASMPKKWLSMLYLTSVYSCMDPRDVIYGIRGLMEMERGEELLFPDYSKSVQEVYRDSVEAAFTDFRNSNVLLYLTGSENPSWIPRWDVDMTFRNPFRFGRAVPWKPAGDTLSEWKIDHERNILSLTCITFDAIEFTAPYNQRVFSNGMMNSPEQRQQLHDVWSAILGLFDSGSSQLPLQPSTLVALAVSLSFGLDERMDLADQHQTQQLYKFVAYLRLVLDRATFDKYIPADVANASEGTDGHLFGKPVWDFEYPTSSVFVTTSQLIGCATAETQAGDLLCAPLGSVYPLILRPEQPQYTIKGYSYAHGVMNGERQSSESRVFEIC